MADTTNVNTNTDINATTDTDELLADCRQFKAAIKPFHLNFHLGTQEGYVHHGEDLLKLFERCAELHNSQKTQPILADGRYDFETKNIYANRWIGANRPFDFCNQNKGSDPYRSRPTCW
jgi:hypothetical protein